MIPTSSCWKQRPALWSRVRGYIRDEFGELLRSEDFLNAMPGLLQEDARLPVLRERLDALASRA